MEIPSNKRVRLPPEERTTSEARLDPSEVLKEFALTAVEIDDSDYDMRVNETRFALAVNFILFLSIIGTLVLLAGGLFYLSVPAPTPHATTQDGQIYELKPLKIVRP
ncbi:hypothetical protein HNP46_000232 [Pseudomonas nitritireducens]|uniref:Uncharacterized protein n=1 Tax=Pseudomonas nitroreducens TaxID=46680 RepID=A0A7W7KFF1_PSENT|nr:hypothetical protein [Pseudomonas nitritireducens]MBB4861421.1 hypothetical protein [Pseudomonas nitritireducens]